MLRPIFVGIPCLALAVTVSRMSDIGSWLLGSHPAVLEKRYCQLLLRVHWYVSFGLDDVVADIIRKSPERHETALITVLNGQSEECSDLAFDTLRLYFSNESTHQALERFIDNLDSADKKLEYRKRMD